MKIELSMIIPVYNVENILRNVSNLLLIKHTVEG